MALVEAALGASENVEVHGPVEQGVFLEQMGIRERAEMLIRGLAKNNNTTGTTAQAEDKDNAEDDAKIDKGIREKAIREAVERLVSRLPGHGMGTLYKALAMVPERGGRKPVGFGGGIAG